MKNAQTGVFFLAELATTAPDKQSILSVLIERLRVDECSSTDHARNRADSANGGEVQWNRHPLSNIYTIHGRMAAGKKSDWNGRTGKSPG